MPLSVGALQESVAESLSFPLLSAITLVTEGEMSSEIINFELAEGITQCSLLAGLLCLLSCPSIA